MTNEENGVNSIQARKGMLFTVLVALVASITGCTTTSGASDPATRRAAIDAGVNDALAQLYREVPGSQDLVQQAKGVLVFPNVLSAGFMVGMSRGDGALRIGGKTQSYHATTSGSFGLQAGAQSTAAFLLFMTQEALTNFQNSNGWTAGVDAGVTLLTAGANLSVTTLTGQQPVVGFVLSNRGLMAGVSMEGNRITRLRL
jgi:lipid-binding SYLF domain-containing protein